MSVLPALAELYGVSVDDMLTGSRRKVFFAGTVLLFLSDAPADIFCSPSIMQNLKNRRVH